MEMRRKGSTVSFFFVVVVVTVPHRVHINDKETFVCFLFCF